MAEKDLAEVSLNSISFRGAAFMLRCVTTGQKIAQTPSKTRGAAIDCQSTKHLYSAFCKSWQVPRPASGGVDATVNNYAVPPTVMFSMRSVGWPTPTGTLWPSLPHTPTPESSRMSLPIMVTSLSDSGPLPTSVAPLTG